MIEIIKAIALLCQLSGDNNATYIYQQQIACQKWYLECYERKTRTGKWGDPSLSQCIKERE